jgi:hypothetical protein
MSKDALACEGLDGEASRNISALFEAGEASPIQPSVHVSNTNNVSIEAKVHT